MAPLNHKAIKWLTFNEGHRSDDYKLVRMASAVRFRNLVQKEDIRPLVYLSCLKVKKADSDIHGSNLVVLSAVDRW